MNHCYPNAITESRSEGVGLYRNEQGGFSCLVDQQEGHCSSDRYSGTLPGAGPIEKEQCRQSKHKHMQQYDAWTWHEDVMWFVLMHLAIIWLKFI